MLILGVIGFVILVIVAVLMRSKVKPNEQKEESQKVVQNEGKAGIQERPNDQAERKENIEKTESIAGSSEITRSSERDTGQANEKESESSSQTAIQVAQGTNGEETKEVKN